jgi:glycosyltransferase involved in cell wall biosynthesis
VSSANGSPRVAVLEHREAGADYVLSLLIGLQENGVQPVAVATPQLDRKARELDPPRDVDVRPYFELAFKGGVRNLLPYGLGWLRTLALFAHKRPDVLHVQWLVRPGIESRALPLIARLLAARLVYTAHNVMPHEPQPGDEEAYGRLYRQADTVVVHTDKSRRELLERFPAVDPAKVVTIAHGNHEYRLTRGLTREEARRRLGIEADRPLAAFVGKLRPYKGVTTLLEAWLDVRERVDAGLLIAGNPDDEAYGRELRAFVGEHGLDDVTLIDRYLGDEEINLAFAAADVIVLPYRAIDQSGILLYAMTHGRAIVASRLESFVDLFGGEDDAGALFHEPDDRAGLADALARALGDAPLRERLARRSYDLAQANHSWPRIARETLSVYNAAPMADAARHLSATMNWLRLAHDVTDDGGVSGGYTHGKGWGTSFPETTGYIVPTFLNHFRHSGDPDFERRARTMTDWLLSIQNADGSFQGGLMADAAGPSVFNTGQILFGLVRAADHFGERRYLHAAIRAGRWLAEVQDPSGEWRRFDFLEQSHVYNTRTAWALLLLAAAAGDDQLHAAGARNIAWSLRQAHADGFYDRLPFDPRAYGARDVVRSVVGGKNRPSFYTKASLHTIAYTIQGLIESAWILGDAEAEAVAVRGAERLAEDARAGRLAGYYDAGWMPATSSACLTGAAQMAIVWLRLGDERGRSDLRDAADAAIALVAGSQDLSRRRADLRGAVAGSKPLWGLYLPFRYPNWAPKFAADAYMLALAADGAYANGPGVTPQVW